ncbi:MAG: porin [Betaproteobacteria bacterium]|nr:MAG: porin [Betaproteobacteria bacterium]
MLAHPSRGVARIGRRFFHAHQVERGERDNHEVESHCSCSRARHGGRQRARATGCRPRDGGDLGPDLRAPRRVHRRHHERHRWKEQHSGSCRYHSRDREARLPVRHLQQSFLSRGSRIPDARVERTEGGVSGRDSFVGLAGSWGAFKIGKTDAPYKLSTARMDPFASSIGDYNSIMGNTGGDNRAEFDTRLSHAAWYESPNISGFRVNALFAPGQNRSSDNSIPASGEPNCTGGNSPDPANGCNDGSYGNALSIAGIYEAGPAYLIAAYEKHTDVNRTGDGAAVGIGDEQAFKVGVQYSLPTNTTLNFIVERMTRHGSVADFNERQRSGFWLAATQKVTASDDVNIGWAHAGKTPGTPDGPLDNKANMLALGYKHHFNRQANWYAVYARQDNKDGAHYDLGASGHGITTDCHDAAGNCYPGGKIQGLSVGMQYNF